LAAQLRRGIERLKQFYIKKLAASGNDWTTTELHSLTIRELENLYKKSLPYKK
jgi:hypothetical protein